MKKISILSFLLIILSLKSFPQLPDSTNKKHEYKRDEYRTLFGRDTHTGTYGAFSFGYSEIDKKNAVTFGGKFEWLVNHSIGLGFGGTGFLNENHFDPGLNSDVFLTGGYGGIIVEPILMPNFPVHLAFPILFGAGGISYITEDMAFDHNMVEDSEAFLIAEPSGELELNLTRHFRLSLGTSYRFTTPFDVGLEGAAKVSSKALEGFSFMMTFKIGRF